MTSASLIPGPWKRSIWRSKTFQTIVSAIGPIVALVFSIIKTTHSHDTALDQIKQAVTLSELTALLHKQEENDWRWTLWPTVAACVWLVLVAVYSFALARREDAEARTRTDPKFLLGPLYVLLTAIERKKKMGLKDLVKSRATIFRVLGDEHEQVVPYVGWSADQRQAGRRWNNSKGLVGRVIHLSELEEPPSPKPVHAQVEAEVTSDESFWRELVNRYNYSIKEARERAPRRLSSLAIPIVDTAAGLVGVVYCDSSERDFFDDETQDFAIATSIAIAKLIRVVNT